MLLRSLDFFSFGSEGPASTEVPNPGYNVLTSWPSCESSDKRDFELSNFGSFSPLLGRFQKDGNEDDSGQNEFRVSPSAIIFSFSVISEALNFVSTNS